MPEEAFERVVVAGELALGEDRVDLRVADAVDPDRVSAFERLRDEVVSVDARPRHQGASAQTAWTQTEIAILIGHGTMIESRAMTTKLERSFDLPYAPEAVMNAMRDPALIEKSERSRDALEVEVIEEERSESRHTYVVRSVSHARTVTGIDRNKTEENRTKVRWDVAACRADWSWTGAHGNKVTVNGGYRVTPRAGGGATLTLDTTIDVKIPVVGRVVEGKIKEGFEKAWPDYVRLVGEHASYQAQVRGNEAG